MNECIAVIKSFCRKINDDNLCVEARIEKVRGPFGSVEYHWDISHFYFRQPWDEKPVYPVRTSSESLQDVEFHLDQYLHQFKDYKVVENPDY